MSIKKTHRVVALAVSILLFGGMTVRTASSEEIKLVVPNAFENVEGDINGQTGTTPYRFQAVYLASEFLSLPETHRTIVGYFLRPDRTVTAPRTVVLNDTLVRLSTTPKSVLDIDFEQNIGDDITTVFDGPVTVSTQATGPPNGPRGFDYFLRFDTPFVYDTNAGNLLVDAISFSGQTPTFSEDFDSSIDAVWNSDPNATSGGRTVGPVLQFVFVPEPSTLLMGALGLVGLAGLNMRSRLSSL